MSETIISVRDLSVRYKTKESTTYAVDNVSFDLERGKVLALVGESGSGKTTAAMSILRLLPMEAEIVSGSIQFDGMDLVALHEDALRKIRGRRIAMIFQDPVAGLNPVITVGSQVSEILTNHLPLSKKEAKQRAIQILRDVGLADPDRVAKAYPFQLSGGMCQRVMIGIATALDPDVLVADEPTSALDVTVQAQILHQLNELRHRRGTTILLITHNFGVVAQMADDVAVMYAGHAVEAGEAISVLKRPLHPYSHALLAALPRMDQQREQLHAIPGHAPDLAAPAEHCPFLPRCNKVTNACRQGPAPTLTVMEGIADRELACYNPIWAG